MLITISRVAACSSSVACFAFSGEAVDFAEAFACAAGLSSCPWAAWESAAKASTQNRISTASPAFSTGVSIFGRVIVVLLLRYARRKSTTVAKAYANENKRLIPDFRERFRVPLATLCGI